MRSTRSSAWAELYGGIGERSGHRCLRLRGHEIDIHGHRRSSIHGAKQVAAIGALFIEEGNTASSLDPGPVHRPVRQAEVDLTTIDAIWSATGTSITVGE